MAQSSATVLLQENQDYYTYSSILNPFQHQPFLRIGNKLGGRNVIVLSRMKKAKTATTNAVKASSRKPVEGRGVYTANNWMTGKGIQGGNGRPSSRRLILPEWLSLQLLTVQILIQYNRYRVSGHEKDGNLYILVIVYRIPLLYPESTSLNRLSVRFVFHVGTTESVLWSVC